MTLHNWAAANKRLVYEQMSNINNLQDGCKGIWKNKHRAGSNTHTSVDTDNHLNVQWSICGFSMQWYW